MGKKNIKKQVMLFLIAICTILFFACKWHIVSSVNKENFNAPYPEFKESHALRTVFVSPQGSGDGSSESTPTNIEQAIENSKAGDLIYLLAGTYTGTYYLTNNGTKAQPIVYKN